MSEVRWQGGARMTSAGDDRIGSLYVDDRAITFVPSAMGKPTGQFAGAITYAGSAVLTASVATWLLAMIFGMPATPALSRVSVWSPWVLLALGVPLGVVCIGLGIAARRMAGQAHLRLLRIVHQDTVDEDVGTGMPLEKRYHLEAGAWRAEHRQVEHADPAKGAVRVRTSLGDDVHLHPVEGVDALLTAIRSAQPGASA